MVSVTEQSFSDFIINDENDVQNLKNYYEKFGNWNDPKCRREMEYRIRRAEEFVLTKTSKMAKYEPKKTNYLQIAFFIAILFIATGVIEKLFDKRMSS